MKTMINMKSVVVFTLLICLFSSCNNTTKETEATVQGDEKIQKVEVVKPQKRSFKGEVLITGTARPDKIVTLYAMENGMVTTMRKDIGDKVYSGEVVAILQNPMVENLIDVAKADIATRNAQVSAAEVKLSASKSIYDRLNSIYTSTPALTTVAELEQAKAATLGEEAMVESAKARLEASRLQLGISQKQAKFLSVEAPFSGIITKRYVDKGAMVQSGLNESNSQALYEIQKVNPIRLSIPVPGSDAVGLKKGMQVQLSLPELSGESFMAEISRISNALDPQTKTMMVEINLDNPKGEILSGMYAKALVQLDSRENILSLPMNAKVNHKNEEYVLAVVDGKVKRLAISIGLSNQDYFEVLNEDISAETYVIVQGKGLVKPGQIVEPILKQDQ